MKTSNQEYSNFITPPDVVNESKINILVIDATPEDIGMLANFCQTADTFYNVYLYSKDMENLDWLALAGDRAHAIIVNSTKNEFSPIKEKLLDLTNCWYYGSETFADQTRKVEKLTDYFSQV